MMLYTERVEVILQQLQEHATVKVAELSQLMHVSVDTVRRDLKSMEQQGMIKYIHGGACLPDVGTSVLNTVGREIVNSTKKQEAARKAAAYVKSGDLVALNSGTTNTILAQELVRIDKEFTVVTNNYDAINLLLQSDQIHLIAIGGDIDPQMRSSCGTVCEQEFCQYYPDIAFLSVNAVNCDDGYTDYRFQEIGIIQMLARHAKQAIAVMDSSKLDQRSKMKILSPGEVDLLVMDDQITEEIKTKYSKNGIQIV